MSVHGQPLEITVVGCTDVKDAKVFLRQDPYVALEYGSTKLRTRACKDGGKNPSFNEKMVLTLIEGLWEINVEVRNGNAIALDHLIGSGKLELQKVLSSAHDDRSWPLTGKNGKHAGDVRVIMHLGNAENKSATQERDLSHYMGPPMASPYLASPMGLAYPPPYPPQVSGFSQPYGHAFPQGGYPPQGYPPNHSLFPGQYPPVPYGPQLQSIYPPSHNHGVVLPQSYPSYSGPGFMPPGYAPGNYKKFKTKHGKHSRRKQYKFNHKHGAFGHGKHGPMRIFKKLKKWK